MHFQRWIYWTAKQKETITFASLTKHGREKKLNKKKKKKKKETTTSFWIWYFSLLHTSLLQTDVAMLHL